jgi:hypothetical protein
MSPCRRFEQEGLLRLEQGLALDPHFDTCPDCREAQAAYASLRNEMARLEAGEEPPPGWMANVIASVERKGWSDSRRAFGGAAAPWATSRSALAFAASFVVAVGLGVSTLQLQKQNHELESLLSTRDSRLGKLETENQRLQESGSRFEAELEELKRPQPNAVIFDLFSREWVQRSGAGSAIAELSLPREARGYVLILSGEGRPRVGEHAVEILDREGKAVWRGEGLRRDPQGNFVITLDRSFLRDGEYRFVLYGKRGEALARVAEYAVRVKSQ